MYKKGTKSTLQSSQGEVLADSLLQEAYFATLIVHMSDFDDKHDSLF